MELNKKTIKFSPNQNSHNLNNMTLQQKRNNLNKALNKISSQILDLWLKEASDICPELSEALEGIYCGHEGRIHEELGGFYKGLYITMGWCKINHTKVEFAYVS
jgi:hypothetical protein